MTADPAVAGGQAELQYDCADGVGTITLNRPDVVNAINQHIRDQLPAAVAAANADPAVRVMVIRGAGPRGFCAGADITEFTPPDSALEARAIKQAATWLDALAGTPKPTIAAIHGYCLGGGLEIALACDIRIAADDAAFGLPEVTLAIIPGAGGTQRLPRVIGVSAALRLILTGQRIGAAEALRLGLVSEVVAAAQLNEAAGQLASRVAGLAPQAVAFAKEAVRSGSALPLADGLRLERDLAAVLMTTTDRAEAAAAFREKRPPVFRAQ